MQVYSLDRDTSTCLGVLWLRDEDNEVPLEFMNGVSLAEGWHPLPVGFYRDEDEHRVPGDLASPLNQCPIFSRRAIDVLRPVLESHGEILPLLCSEGEYYAFNLLAVRDAVDPERAQFWRGKTGVILEVLRYAFLSERLRDTWIFWTPELKNVMVTDKFVRLVQQNGLTGFRFVLRWDSEKP